MASTKSYTSWSSSCADTQSSRTHGGLRTLLHSLGSDSSSTLGTSGTEGDLYDILLESTEQSFTPGILFGWWPPSGSWSHVELVQTSTQCLPAVRPGWDLVALPSLPEVQELWVCWSQEHSLGSHQAIWYEPRLEGSGSKDPAAEVCREVLAALARAREAPQQQMLLKSLCFFPRHATPSVIAEAACCNGLRVLRQSSMPAIHGRTWQHPRVSAAQSPRAPSFRDLLPPGLNGVRYLRGYEAKDKEDLREAWRRLQQECPPGSRFVLKFLGAPGCGGSVTDVQDRDLETFSFEVVGSSASVVLEEMVVGIGQPKPRTLDMVGDVPCGSIGEEHLPRCCALAAQRIGKLWGLHGPWSLDFATDSEGARVVVGINVGCPSKNLAAKLWASRATHWLAVSTGEWTLPRKDAPSLTNIMESLRAVGLLWDGDEGVIVYQHNRGTLCAYAVASSFGDWAVKVLTSKLMHHMWASFNIA